MAPRSRPQPPWHRLIILRERIKQEIFDDGYRLSGDALEQEVRKRLRLLGHNPHPPITIEEL